METLIPSLREEGIRALRAGDLESAGDLLARAAAADARDAEARAFLGVAYSEGGRHDEARRALEEAVELQPHEPRFHYNLGVAMENSGDTAAAAAAYQEVLKLYPAHPHARSKLNALAPREEPAASAPFTGTAATAATAPWLQGGHSPALAGAADLFHHAAPSRPAMAIGEAFGRRLAASLLDAVICYGISYVVSYLIGLILFVPAVAIAGPQAVAWIVPVGLILGLFIQLVVGWLCYIVPLSRYGQTVGKLVLGLRVVGPDGSSPGLWRAVLRETIGSLVSGLSLGLGCLWMLWDRNQQTWHDKIAGTTVERV